IYLFPHCQYLGREKKESIRKSSSRLIPHLVCFSLEGGMEDFSTQIKKLISRN
ncbi:unnamed protein product, partial [Gulo gulo]